MDLVKEKREVALCHWVGIDVAKATFDAGLVRGEQRFPHTPLSAVPARHFERTEQGVMELLGWLDGLVKNHETVHVCMEATGAYSTELAVWLLKKRPALRPAIVNPARSAAFIKSLGLRNKTDKLEARALGFYGVERRPAAFEPPSRTMAELRALSRYRSRLVEEKVAEGNRAGEPAMSKSVARMQQRRLRQIERDIETLNQKMKALVDKTPKLKQDIETFTAVYGIGFVTAVIVRTELGDLRRFERARQLTAFAGMSPRIVESGTSLAGKPHLCKQGNSRVRHALYMAAMTAIRGQNDLQCCYQRLVAKGKSHMSALGAIMRKMLCLLRALLISGNPYQRQHLSCG